MDDGDDVMAEDRPSRRCELKVVAIDHNAEYNIPFLETSPLLCVVVLMLSSHATAASRQHRSPIAYPSTWRHAQWRPRLLQVAVPPAASWPVVVQEDLLPAPIGPRSACGLANGRARGIDEGLPIACLSRPRLARGVPSPAVGVRSRDNLDQVTVSEWVPVYKSVCRGFGRLSSPVSFTRYSQQLSKPNSANMDSVNVIAFLTPKEGKLDEVWPPDRGPG